MDNFGVKYAGNEHANHLLAVLRQNYVVDDNEKGNKYCEINLDWDYKSQEYTREAHESKSKAGELRSGQSGGEGLRGGEIAKFVFSRGALTLDGQSHDRSRGIHIQVR